MGVYHEPRVPQGSPTTGEKDVWLEGGEIKFGHWDGSDWVVDRTIGSVEDSGTIDNGTDLLAAEDWHLVGNTGEAQFNAGWTNTSSLNPMKYRLLTTGAVEVRGEVVCDSSANPDIMTMPTGYRPAENYTSTSGPTSQFYNTPASEWVDYFVDVYSNGEFAWGQSVSSGDKMRFLSFCYPL